MRTQKNPKSLANLRPAKPGEVRNPKGNNRKRPWTDRMFERSEMLLASTEEGEQIRKALQLPKEATFADAAVLTLMRKAIKGDVGAIKEMADRIEGKAPERLEITGPDRKEITIRLLHDREKRKSSE